MAIRIKVVMGKYIWLVKSSGGYTMPLEEYYQFKARKGNNIINPKCFKCLLDLRINNA